MFWVVLIWWAFEGDQSNIILHETNLRVPVWWVFFLIIMCTMMFCPLVASFCMIPADSLYMQFVARLTAGIIQTYQQCDPNFKYSDENNPKRFLTSPSIPAHNDGLDNANWDLILYVNLELVNKMSNRRLLFYNLVFNVPYLLISLYWNVPCYFGTQVYSQGNAWPGNIWSSCQMLGHRN